MGVPDLIIGFSSLASVSLSLFNPTILTTSAQLDAASGIGSRVGTLSLTRFFGTGESGNFLLETKMHAVPAPDMLWPTLIGMIAIAVFFRRRQRSEAMTY